MKITWITFDRLVKKNGQWYSKHASLRYRVVIPVTELTQQNYAIEMINVDKNTNIQSVIQSLKQTEVLIFSKSFNSLNETLAIAAKSMGIKIIFDICDNHFEHPQGGPHYHTLINLADQIVVNTMQMAKIVAKYTNRQATVITDPYEGQRNTPCFAPKNNVLQLLWFGHAGNLDSLQAMIPQLLPLSQQIQLKLHLITSADQGIASACTAFNQQHGQQFKLRFSEWSLKTLSQGLKQADIVLIPTLAKDTKLIKSHNRLVEALWAGRFVVAQPIPSYQEFAQWAYVEQDIVAGIEWALQNSAQVLSHIAQAQDYIAENFSPNVIGTQWANVITQLLQKELA